ncbi:MAG TPA: aspartyl protease family protein [Ignavibacteria bacterium]|nr:aspartyl protease family protein [Ignavibacteria bacterium]
MKFIFKKFKTGNNSIPFILMPYIQYEIKLGNRSFISSALIDTGASYTLINKSFAELIEFDWRSGKIIKIIGISGKQIDAYLHSVEIKLPQLNDNYISTNVAFTDCENIGILLGHIGFFEHFNMAFVYNKNSFYINPS